MLNLAADPIAAIPLFAGCSKPQLERLRNIASPSVYEKGGYIFTEGLEATGFYVVAQGQVKIFKAAPDGREQILHIMGPGEHFAEVAMFSGSRYPANAMALSKARIIFFPKEPLVALMRSDPALCWSMLGSMARRLREFASIIEGLTLRELPARLASYLLLAAESAGGQAVELDVSKTLLAGLLGASRETISRALAKLADSGFIRLEGRRILIENPQGLDALAKGEEKLGK